MEKISALMDGELDESQARHEFARLRQQSELREKWDTFHLIGDALRGESLLSAGFARRLSERLAHEPTVLAPRRAIVKKLMTYGLSVAASLSAVALVGWVAFSTSTVDIRPEITRAPAPAVALSAPAPQLASVPSEGSMNEYLLAHQEFSPSTAIQGVVPYIRSVSSARSAKNR